MPADAYDREAFFQAFDARMKAQKAETREREERHRHRLVAPRPAPIAPAAPVVPSPTYRMARNDDQAAAAAILDAFHIFEPAAASIAPPAGPTTAADEAAVSAIMGAFRAANPERT